MKSKIIETTLSNQQPIKEFLKSDRFKQMLSEFNLKKDDFTCLNCNANETCEFSFDPYNTHGDCLGLK